MQNKAGYILQIKSQKSIFLRLRWVVIIATSYLIAIDGDFKFNTSGSIFVVLFILSNLIISRLPERYFASRYFYPAAAAADICIVSAAIYTLGKQLADFYVMYFFIIMLSAIGESIIVTLIVASVSAFIYVVYLLRTSAVGAELPMRIMFLFVVAMVNAFMVDNFKKERQRRHYLEERRKIEEKILPLQKAVETTQIGVTVTDTNGRILYTNPAEANMHGYTNEELLGKDARIFAPAKNWNPMRLDQIKKMKSLKRESINIHKNGAVFPVQLISDVVMDSSGEPIGIITTCEDISERKRAEKALRSANDFLEKVMDNSTNGIFALDKENRFLLVNHRISEITGYSAYELVGQPFSVLFPPEQYSRISEQFVKTTFNITMAQDDTEIICKDNNKCSVNLSIAPLLKSGDSASIIGTIENITRRKHAEETTKKQLTAMEASIDGIAILDQDRKYVYVNNAYASIYGYDNAEELIGEKWTLYNENERFDTEIMSSLARDGRWRGEAIGYKKEGDTFHQEIAITAIDNCGFVCIVRDITERKSAEEVMRHIAYYDTLTGLPNRMLFYDRLAHALAHARRNRRMSAVMFLDIDRFKNINDTLGHNTGDLLLQSISERLKRCVREADAVSRVGGDEFTIIFQDINQTKDIDIVANKILRAMSRPYLIDEHELFVTASIGISMFPSDGDDIETLVKNADTAMYTAKELGRNNYQFYKPVMHAESHGRLALENSMRKAVERREFLLHYQPQVDLRTGKVIGVEALLRWQHPVHGLLMPAEFIPLAEETGLIVSIGEWMVHAACKQNKAWQNSGLLPIRMAVNLSMRQFRQKDLLDTIARILKDTGLAPNYLEAELTESIVMQNAEETINTLRELKAMGIHLTIDDFGTGYSSLSYLKYLPISKLKLSQSFVHAISKDPNDEAISRAIIVLASSLNIRVIAEGIETHKQVEFLRMHNCDEGQGYLFSTPLPAEKCTRMLLEERLLATF